MTQVSIHAMYTSLRVAAWAAVGLLCLLCGCGSDNAPSPYDRVASQTRYERALLPTQGVPDVELDADLADEVCLYLHAANGRTAIRRGQIGALQLRECRLWLRAQSTLCQESLLDLYDCLSDKEAHDKLLHPRTRPAIELSACVVQASATDVACADGVDNDAYDALR